MHFGIIFALTVNLYPAWSASYQPLFNDAISEVRAIAGQTAILPCSVRNKGEHMIIWMNPKRILFSKEEFIVINDGRVGVESSPDGDWNLRIDHVRYNDSGEYSCQINTNPVKIKRVYLYIQVPSHILNSDSSRGMDVEEGSNVTVTCKATGVPQPNITWFRRPFVTLESKDYLNTEGEILQIPDIRRFQSGYYVCLAYNGVPPAVTREMAVRVQYPPVVKLLNRKLGQILGKETILECSVTSYPRARITWIKNGVPISHSYKYRLELYPGQHDTHTLTLQILRINVHDYGDYTCEAENRMGREMSTMLLYEYKDPTPTTTEYFTTPRRLPTTTQLVEEYYYWVDRNSHGFREEEYVVLADGRKRPADNKYGDRWNDRQGYMKSHDNHNNATGVKCGVCVYVIMLLIATLLNDVS